MTKVERFEAIKELVKDNAEYVAFLDGEIARLEKRAAKVNEKRAEKNAEKDVTYREGIVKALEDADRPITLAELVAGLGVEDATPGRVAHYAGKLVKEGKIARDKAKVEGRKVTVYALA